MPGFLRLEGLFWVGYLTTERTKEETAPSSAVERLVTGALPPDLGRRSEVRFGGVAVRGQESYATALLG